jgi:predicted dehydrogenase
MFTILLIRGMVVISAVAAPEAAQPDSVLHLGMVGYEGHGSVWTNDLAGPAGARAGMRVTHVWHRSPIDSNVATEKRFEVVGSPIDLIGKVDGVIIAEELPHRYGELAEPFIRAGIRTFINRPLAGSAEAAAAILRLARESNNPIFAASALAVDPAVVAVRGEWQQYAPLKIVNATGPSDHFWWYVPHTISMLVTALGPGIEEVQTHDFVWKDDRITFRDPLVVFFRYAADSAVGPVRGTMQVLPQTQSGDWYGFRLKLYGRKESPEFQCFKLGAESPWMHIYETMSRFFRTGERPFTDEELFEVPLVLDMIQKSGLEKRAVRREEYTAIIQSIGGP